jgi:uncharacterized membrane protein
MTKRDVLSIAFKILGIISIMRVIESVFAIGMGVAWRFGKSEVATEYYDPQWFLWTGILSFVLWFAMAYFLLKWGDLFAQKLIRDDNVISLPDKDQWERPVFILSLKIIAVVYLIMGIPGLIRLLFDLVVSATGHWHQKPIISTNINVNAIVLVIFGVYLLSGGKYLVEFVYRERQSQSKSQSK